jgi:hypothetical protein
MLCPDGDHGRQLFTIPRTILFNASAFRSTQSRNNRPNSRRASGVSNSPGLSRAGVVVSSIVLSQGDNSPHGVGDLGCIMQNGNFTRAIFWSRKTRSVIKNTVIIYCFRSKFVAGLARTRHLCGLRCTVARDSRRAIAPGPSLLATQLPYKPDEQTKAHSSQGTRAGAVRQVFWVASAEVRVALRRWIC